MSVCGHLLLGDVVIQVLDTEIDSCCQGEIMLVPDREDKAALEPCISPCVYAYPLLCHQLWIRSQLDVGP